MNNQKGFTLFEVLLVLSILLTIFSFPLLQLEPLNKPKKVDNFFQQFENDLLLSQQNAIRQNSLVRVIFYSNQSQYIIISAKNNQTILIRSYDSDIRIVPGTLGSTLMYLQNGNISKSGAITIHIDNDRYQVVFMLGKGRFNVSKL